MTQRRIQEPLVHLLTRAPTTTSIAASATTTSPRTRHNTTRAKKRRILTRHISNSALSTSRSRSYDHPRYRELTLGLWNFLSTSSRSTSSSSSSKCRHWHAEQRRYYSPPATALAPLDDFTLAEKDEIFFELVSSPPPPVTEIEQHWSYSYHHHHQSRSSGTPRISDRDGVAHVGSWRKRPPATAGVKAGPPEMSRQVLWDWRRWSRSKKRGVQADEVGADGKKKAKGKAKAKDGFIRALKRRKQEYTTTSPSLSPGDPFYEEIEEYKKHFEPAIDAEQYEDEAVLRERLATWHISRLKDEGYCITDLSAFWMDKDQFGRPTATFGLSPGQLLPEHRFENGTQALLSRIDPLTEQPYRGSVVSTSASQIRICFSDRFDLDSGVWRLDVGRPDLVFERMRAAIRSLNFDIREVQKREKEEEDVRAAANGAVDQGPWEYILQGTELRDVLLGGFSPVNGKKGMAEEDDDRHEEVEVEYGAMEDEQMDPYAGIDWEPEEVRGAGEELVAQRTVEKEGKVEGSGGVFSEDQRIQSWVKRYSLPVPLVMDGDMPLTGMNPSQIKAMALMVGQRVSLVQGPPGTGKTKTIIQTLKLLKSHFGVPQPILVCTYTNAAVDNLVEGFASSGLTPLRVGFGPNIRPALIQHSLGYKLEQHPKNAELAALVLEQGEVAERLDKLQKQALPLEGKRGVEGRLRNMKAALAKMGKQVGILKGKGYSLQQRMLRDVIAESDVICTTCITSATSALNIVDFPIVFLDEASMSTEPASLIPLMKGSRHLALIGDHKQLPPVIISKEAQTIGLGISLFERLTREGNTPSVMLDTQYRMHPGISRFPSSEFYLGNIRDGTVDEKGNVMSGLTPPESLYLRAVSSPAQHPHQQPQASSPSPAPYDAGGAWEENGDGSDVKHRVADDGWVPEDKLGVGDTDVASSKWEGCVDEQQVQSGQAGGPSVIFLDHAGNETLKDRSRVNYAEAHIIASVVVDLLLSNPELRGADIGIIAPYVAQISLLTKMFNKHPQYKAQFIATLGDARHMQLSEIEIKTVDGFEGREKEVILFSTVRNNMAGHIGFLADKRRLNVGLTRAKRALFVVGNIATLREGKMEGTTVRVGKGAESWRRYTQYLTEGGLVVQVRGEAVARGMGRILKL